MTLFQWTDERCEQLRRLVEQGLSGTDIARELGCPSRNSVIGKMHRLGLSKPRFLRPPPQEPVRRRRPSRPRVLSVPEVEELPAAPVREPEPPLEERVVTEQHRVPFNVFGSGQVIETESRAVSWTEETTTTQVGWDHFRPATMCHWPIRSDPHMFCGAPINAENTNMPYCSRHRARALKREEKME